jgi:hypothetical protein
MSARGDMSRVGVKSRRAMKGDALDCEKKLQMEGLGGGVCCHLYPVMTP